MDSILIARDSIREVTGNGIMVLARGGDPYYSWDWNHLVAGVRIHRNTIKHTAGDGIFIDGSDSEVIDSNYVFGVGSLGKSGGGEPTKGTGTDVGIFVMNHKNGIIEYNEVDSTYMPIGDAQAFDNDGGLSGVTIIQYNYTNDNAGGLLQEHFSTYTNSNTNSDGTLIQYSRDDTYQPSYTIFRYNVSHDDGNVPHDYSNATAGNNFIQFARGGAQVYNNTFYCRDSLGFYMQPNKAGIVNGPNSIQNNIFVGTYANWNETSNSYNNNWYYYNWPAGVTYSRPTNVWSLGEPGPVGDWPSYGNYYLPYNDLTAYNASTEVTGHYGNPQLMGEFSKDNWDTTNDFRLTQGTSCPCYNIGTHISNSGNIDLWGYQFDSSSSNRNAGADQNFIGDVKVKRFLFFGKN